MFVNGEFLLLADDLKLDKCESTTDDVLHGNFDSLFNWYTGNDDILNSDKCKAITFSCFKTTQLNIYIY